MTNPMPAPAPAPAVSNQPVLPPLTATPPPLATPAPEPAAQPAKPDVYPSGIPSRLDLPSGGWVEFRDPDNLRARDQRHILAAIKNPDNALSVGLDAAHGLACMLINAWSFPVPPPLEDPDQLDDLRMPDYSVIIKTVGPLADLMFQDTRSTDNAQVPGSPTRPATV